MSDYVVEIRVEDPYSEDEHDVLVDYLDNAGFDVSREGDDLMLRKETGGNVDAVQHLRTAMFDLEDCGLEAGALQIKCFVDKTKIA